MVNMKYTIGKRRDNSAYCLVKVWKGETLEKACEVNGCEVVDANMTFDDKRAAHKGLRALLRLQGGKEDARRYDPSGDKLLTEIGKLHPGDGYVIQISVKDRGNGPEVLVQRYRAVAGGRFGIGGLGRMAPGAAAHLARLITKAVESANTFASTTKAQ